MSGVLGILRADGTSVHERFPGSIAEAIRFRGAEGRSVSKTERRRRLLHADGHQPGEMGIDLIRQSLSPTEEDWTEDADPGSRTPHGLRSACFANSARVHRKILKYKKTEPG